MTLYYFILFLLWLCFGSFSTVLVSRWYSGKWWIATGRSECPHCQHRLSALELIPLFSWILQWWKCKNCKVKIPLFYPTSELFMWALFVWSGWLSLSFWYGFTESTWWLFLFWTFVTWVYVIYDLAYMEIPDQILIPWILITIIALVLSFWEEKYLLFFDLYSYKNFHTFLTDHVSSAIFAYSFFFLQILIPGTIYFIRMKAYKHMLGLFMSYFTFPFITLWEFFSKRNQIDHTVDAEAIPTWIGWGDLRIAIFIGLSLWWIHTLTSLFFAYCIGSIIWIWILISARIQWKEQTHEVPFWPFLAAGWILSLTFYTEILDYVNLFFA